MWMEKLSRGVLRVLTPIGPRYIKPVFLERLYLLWIFRNFTTLPHQVLTGRQQRLVDALCTSQEFVSLLHTNGFDEVPVIGTVERLNPLVVDEPVPARRPLRVPSQQEQTAD